MCGLVGTVGQSNLLPALLDGLRRLEYRGYDSAGVAVLTDEGGLRVRRTVGPVQRLAAALNDCDWAAHVGIGHTRWATHGEPTRINAHPQTSGRSVAVVHNGIIENQAELRRKLTAEGFRFRSQTDTEVIAHNVAYHLRDADTLLEAVRRAVAEFEGSYAIAVVCRSHPEHVVAARRGSPLIIGVSEGANLLASDLAALLPITKRYIPLEDGDIAQLNRHSVNIIDPNGNPTLRALRTYTLDVGAVDKGSYSHFMQKEIFAQPSVVADALDDRTNGEQIRSPLLEPAEDSLLERTRHIHIVACGTSYHAGLVAQYAVEALTGCTCSVELASEYRYRKSVVQDGTLLVTLSQSGETADTLAALREAKKASYLASLTICNVGHSSMVRESDYLLAMRAGPEIGVASTKAFTAQLVCLLLLALNVRRARGLADELDARLVRELQDLPARIGEILADSDRIKALAASLVDARHAIFLGRGPLFPIALEGALKLKEISYIHAEGYAAGELKHGPLALIDRDMPVISLLPDDAVREKMLSNLQEVQARGGRLIIFGETEPEFEGNDSAHFIRVPRCSDWIRPLLYTVPLQLLAYHVAALRGNDVDKPRNLAKSVTVE